MANPYTRIAYALPGLLTLLGVGAAYQALAVQRDHRKYPPPGHLVDVGGYHLHAHSLGAGEPTVIMVSGYGSIALDWHPIIAEVSQFSRVFTYDRAGYGWSEPSPQPRTIPLIIEELRTLLRQLGIQGPFVTVGHSLGGIYLQYWARRYPNEISGMVLIDSAHPEGYRRLTKRTRQQSYRWRRRRLLMVYLGWLRLGIMLQLLPTPASAKLPLAVQHAITRLSLRPQYWNTIINEEEYLGADTPAVIETAGLFPEIPLTVMTSPDTTWLAANGPEFPLLWSEWQRQLASLTPSGQLLIVEESSHFIHHDQPGVVTAAIQQIIERVRK